MCKWQIIANTLSLSHSLISSLIHSLIPSPPHSFTPSPMQLPQHLQETVGTLLAESQWTCTGKRETRVVCPPHSCSWLTLHMLTSSRIVHQWQRAGWRGHCSYPSTHTASSSSSSSSPPKAHQTGERRAMSHTLLHCVISLLVYTLEYCALVHSSPLTRACMEVHSS